MRMLGKIVIGLLLVIVGLLITAQLLLPGRVASDVEARLTEGGGEAEVEIEALPAARLLLGDGDRIEVTGSGLVLDVENDSRVLDKLDGFDQVDVSLTDLEAGPFDVASFELERAGGGTYTLRSQATTTGAELLEFGGEAFGAVAGGIAGFLSEEAPDAANEPFTAELDATISSEDGDIRIVDGGGTVEGYPIGPLAELITAAVVSRL